MVEGFLPWCGELGTFRIRHINLLFRPTLLKMSLGDLSDVGTPGNIPNPVVKHVSADGTWRETSWESRSLPRGFSFNKIIKTFSVLFLSGIMLPVDLVEGS